jgi:hypothetical protein
MKYRRASVFQRKEIFGHNIKNTIVRTGFGKKSVEVGRSPAVRGSHTLAREFMLVLSVRSPIDGGCH